MRSNVDITFHPSWWYKHTGVEFDEKFFFDADYRLEADVKMRRKLFEYFGEFGIGEEDPKPRPILFSDLIACGFLYSQMMGCQVIFQKDNAPQVVAANLSEDAVENLIAPNLDENPLWQNVQSQIDRFVREFGYVESAINLMGVKNIALDLRGEELFYDYFDDPELMHHLYSVVTEHLLDVGKRLYAVTDLVSGGVTSIIKQVVPNVYLTSNCTVTMISNAQYEEHVLPYDTRLAEAFPCYGIHHCGNNMENVIEGYLKVPNLKFLEIGAGSNLEKIAQAVGDRDIISCIRYSPVAMQSDSLEQMQAKTQAAIDAFGGDEKLCFSCVGIDNTVDLEKIRQYLSVFRG